MRKYAQENFWGGAPPAAPPASAPPTNTNFWNSNTQPHITPIHGFNDTPNATSAGGSALPGLAHWGTSIAGARAIQPRVAAQVAANVAPRLATHLAPLGVDTIVNAGVDALDAGGIYSMDGDKPNPHFWQRPATDALNNPRVNAAGEPGTELGWNPSAFGWDTAAFNRRTTPDGTIAGGYSTGNRYVDTVAGRATSSLNAYSRPLQSAASLLSFQNSLLPNVFDARERRSWGNVLSGRNDIGNNNQSLPLQFVRGLTQNPLAPGPAIMNNPAAAQREIDIHRRNNTYHRIYNPEGTVNRPRPLSQFFNSLWDY